ncbi:DUF4357 domain-containing protein [Bifidobacterium pseudolongum]|uniref:Bacteriophage T5 Orf172 DNA-binding domain-containing protein n=1 Tax=Bifidobacterium pseudolongum subsp. globosum TaxID=1690 RepID=A0A2N3QX92_9BIFI|nr:DUF4357 domain-containing protein [Bifidobacterium pseudolongum]PKU97334.1 hypothetical protein CQR56_0801 [Bifidobacterium pseudolongum subsp. globosum]PKV06048.1 hypothetical protein CQR53_0349 [Bifidobacterium pseudolongum subsp. globosum]RYQ75314.1 hypothetical protein PG1655B_0913 [Bifidobacterium pseudolongum subsp. globosum]RYQ76740.1 hypothetical protein PG1678B_0087 [Bifidobacterium pseudolongum subsp. globosum]
MATGVLYVMSTVVPGLIKIGKTTTDRFDSRMYELERNGYNNVTGLRREFAIEVERYDEKERMLDDIFAKARVPGSELFALDINLAIELLASFEGRQIYPKSSAESKREVFAAAAKNHQENADIQGIPEGTYYLSRKRPPLHVEMVVEDGILTIRAGQRVAEYDNDNTSVRVRELRRSNVDVDGTVRADVCFSSPSQAGAFATGRSSNGWLEWKAADGQSINIFRAHQNSSSQS